VPDTNKPAIETPEVDVQEQMKTMQAQMNTLQTELATTKQESANKDGIISKFDITLAEELDKITVPPVATATPPQTPDVDTNGIYDRIMKKRDEEKADQEKQREVSEVEKIKQRNVQLEFEIGVGNLMKDEPYLEDFIKEGVDEKRFKTIDDVKMGLTPTVKRALQYDYNKAQEYVKSGRDPLERYAGVEEATDQEVRKQNRKENLTAWNKLLS